MAPRKTLSPAGYAVLLAGAFSCTALIGQTLDQSHNTKLVQLSENEVLQMYEKTGLAIQDTYALPTDQQIGRPLIRYTPGQQDAIRRFHETQREIVRRKAAIVSELIAFLKREVPQRRKAADDAVAVPGFVGDVIDLLVEIRDPTAASVFVEILDGFGGVATPVHRNAALEGIEKLTLCSFRRTRFSSNYAEAIEHVNAVNDDPAFRIRAAGLYRNWLAGPGKNSDDWPTLARQRAKEILQGSDSEAIFCAAAFLRPATGRDDNAEKTLTRLAEVISDFRQTDTPQGYSWKNHPLSVPVGNWMALLGNYGALAQPHADVLIRLQNELGAKSWDGIAILGRIGGDRATSYLIDSLPALEGTSLECCRIAIDQLAGLKFTSDHQRIEWWQKRQKPLP